MSGLETERPRDPGAPISSKNYHATTTSVNSSSQSRAADNRSALEVARWLVDHPAVSCVLHPGLECHPQHGLALKQMTGYGGKFSFRLRGGEKAVFRALERVRLLTLAESLGGVESLIEHPVTMTHVSMAAEVRNAMGITSDPVRISVGLEDVLADLAYALQG